MEVLALSLGNLHERVTSLEKTCGDLIGNQAKFRTVVGSDYGVTQEVYHLSSTAFRSYTKLKEAEFETIKLQSIVLIDAMLKPGVSVGCDFQGDLRRKIQEVRFLTTGKQKKVLLEVLGENGHGFREDIVLRFGPRSFQQWYKEKRDKPTIVPTGPRLEFVREAIRHKFPSLEDTVLGFKQWCLNDQAGRQKAKEEAEEAFAEELTLLEEWLDSTDFEEFVTLKGRVMKALWSVHPVPGQWERLASGMDPLPELFPPGFRASAPTNVDYSFWFP